MRWFNFELNWIRSKELTPQPISIDLNISKESHSIFWKLSFVLHGTEVSSAHPVHKIAARNPHSLLKHELGKVYRQRKEERDRGIVGNITSLAPLPAQRHVRSAAQYTPIPYLGIPSSQVGCCQWGSNPKPDL